MDTIFLLRHGETDWNREGRVMGRREIGLNRKGVLQVKRLLPLLRTMRIRRIYFSPLRRAKQTGEILARDLRVPAEGDSDLTEVAFGRWEGLRLPDLRRDRAYLRFLHSPAAAPVPGGETMRDVQRRALRAIRRARKLHPAGRILFVTHADVIRAALCHYLRLPLAHVRRLRIDNASLCAVAEEAGFAEVKFWNLTTDPGQSVGEPFQGLNPGTLRPLRKAQR
jgi:probable phosphoglycerate mutase